MTKLGMDVDAVRALADRLDAEAQRVQYVIGVVDGIVRRTHTDWRGSDAQRFADDWYNRFKPALQRAHDSVAGLAAMARRNVTEQQVASNDAGLSGRPGSVPPGSPMGWLRLPVIGPNPVNGQRWDIRDFYATPYAAVVPGGMALLAGTQVHNVEEALNRQVSGLGDVTGDVVGLIPGGVGSGISIATDGSALVQDLGTGQFNGWDVVHVGRDVVDLVPVVGEVDGAFKLGYDTGHIIANIPAVHHQINSIDDGIAQYGERQGGDIATRYDGASGFVNFVGDFFGSIGL